MLTNDWFVCVRFVPWKKNFTHFIKLWSICCETCVYCRADYSSCSVHGLEKFKDVVCWSKYSRFVFKSVLCFSLQYFFLFYRFNDFFFFFEKMLYHLMVLVAPVILCFSSKSYYTFFWKPGWHRLLVISRGFLFIFNFLIYFFFYLIQLTSLFLITFVFQMYDILALYMMRIFIFISAGQCCQVRNFCISLQW